MQRNNSRGEAHTGVEPGQLWGRSGRFCEIEAVEDAVYEQEGLMSYVEEFFESPSGANSL